METDCLKFKVTWVKTKRKIPTQDIDFLQILGHLLNTLTFYLTCQFWAPPI